MSQAGSHAKDDKLLLRRDAIIRALIIQKKKWRRAMV
jgi:hypothetical protein